MPGMARSKAKARSSKRSTSNVRSNRGKLGTKMVTRGAGAKRGTVGPGFGLELVPTLK